MLGGQGFFFFFLFPFPQVDLLCLLLLLLFQGGRGEEGAKVFTQVKEEREKESAIIAPSPPAWAESREGGRKGGRKGERKL